MNIERTALLEQICRTALDNIYEECILVDISSDSIQSPPDEFKAGSFIFTNVCRDGYDTGIRHMMEDCAFDEEDRAVLASLLLDELVPVLIRDGKVSVRFRLKDECGGALWKQAECAFLSESEERILMLVADIQQEEKIKQDLRDAAVEAEAASRAKSAFLANMSHEIRTPMNAIVGISEVLMRRDLPNDVLESLSTIQNSGSSLLGIINDILDFSKIETGKFEITDVDYMLPSLLMDISNVISVRLASKPVYFMMDIDPELPNHFIGDDIRIKQILMNLLGNAVKFTHEGYIFLKVRGEFLEDRSYELRFDVKDSGIGIREEDLGKLFDSFSQVDTRKNRGTTGTGLGLTISRNLARLMGGDLTVSSVYGQGSTFSVRILQKVPRYIPLGEVRDKNVKLLICEQNESLVQGLSIAAENLGLKYDVCREIDKIREYQGMTHVIIRRRNFGAVQEKLNFMFPHGNILIVLDNDELPDSAFMDYKQLQLPLITLQLINALNGDEIVSSIKKTRFDRAQIIPLTFAHILIVDDNMTNLQVAQGLMSPYHMKIDVTTSGFEAIEMVKKNHYDAIFMDHMMPEMDGIEAAGYIRGLEGDYFKEVPIIALTANAMSDAREQFQDAGMNDFVAKPIEMQELHRVIKKYIQSRAPEGYLEQVSKARETEAEKKGSAAKAKTSSSGAGRMSDAAKVSAPRSAEAAASLRIVNTSGDGMLSQLLSQNNALLEQNMILLRTLIGGASDVQAAAELKDFYESDDRTEADDQEMIFDDAPEETEAASTDELPDFIHGVDMRRSLETYGGSVDIYHNILRTYYYDICEKEDMLPELFSGRDTENFTIQVHALKSASRGVGAFDLGEDAYSLEMAGKDGDWDTIEKLFPPFCEALHQMVENVGAYVNKYLPDTENADAEYCEKPDPELVKELKESCEQMDYLQAEEILKKLRANRYPDDISSRIEELYACCSAFDYDRLDSLVRELGDEA